MSEHVAHKWGSEKYINNFSWGGEGPQRKRPLGRSVYMWEGNIKMNLKDVGYECVVWIKLTQDEMWWQALVNSVMNFQVP
jgi:hypothetical protein